MSLDLDATAAQIEALAAQLRSEGQGSAARLAAIVAAAQASDYAGINSKAEASAGLTFFSPAEPLEPLGARHDPPPLPPDFRVLAVDGSHIDVDRHLPARCYLINLGACVLTYGSRPDAVLSSRPRLYASEDELYLADPASPTNRMAVEGPILGLVRTVQEAEHLAEIAAQQNDTLPTLALIDGSLILWQLAGRDFQGEQRFVRERLLRQGFLRALDTLQSLSHPDGSGLALAAYISLPRSTEVMSTLRLALCPYDRADCRGVCAQEHPGERPCDPVQGFVDREVFAHTLGPGQRSALFRTRSSIVRDEYGPHQVCFFYLNAGEEMARVEMPAWVAEDPERLALVHALTLDQARRGQGYPTAVQEAHEQAVVSGADRELFRQLLEEALEGQGLAVYTSEKRLSKLRRIV
ncbi:MAG: DNA double-strand break repair nuclease NurA [Chloroflexi bacterium]|nr:DNA double-strand break repair nuclease NurA [Chloroflexota bacterium]